ncbi:MAG: integrase [Nitrospira sp.]|nr:MAG: integrase [Nitrospira sp.]
MEARCMARRSKHEYLRVMWQRYQRAGRRERSALLDEVTRVCRYHRKYAIGLLSRAAPARPPVRRVARRRPTYSAEVIRFLAQIWEASGYLCGQRLKAALPHWLPWGRKRMGLTPSIEQQLLRISPRQIDRRLRERKRRLKRRLYGTTRPGSLLKHMIPIKTDHWDVTKSGYLEIDLASHSGASAAGEFLQTLDCVDIHTTWVERQAVMGKGCHGVVQAMTTPLSSSCHSRCAGLTPITAVSSSTRICGRSVSSARPVRPCSSPGRGPLRRMTMPMWSRRTGPMSASWWAGSATTPQRPWRPSTRCMRTCGSSRICFNPP